MEGQLWWQQQQRGRQQIDGDDNDGDDDDDDDDRERKRKRAREQRQRKHSGRKHHEQQNRSDCTGYGNQRCVNDDTQEQRASRDDNQCERRNKHDFECECECVCEHSPFRGGVERLVAIPATGSPAGIPRIQPRTRRHRKTSGGLEKTLHAPQLPRVSQARQSQGSPGVHGPDSISDGSLAHPQAHPLEAHSKLRGRFETGPSHRPQLRQVQREGIGLRPGHERIRERCHGIRLDGRQQGSQGRWQGEQQPNDVSDDGCCSDWRWCWHWHCCWHCCWCCCKSVGGCHCYRRRRKQCCHEHRWHSSNETGNAEDRRGRQRGNHAGGWCDPSLRPTQRNATQRNANNTTQYYALLYYTILY
mmetsp:Transcript_19993/g.46722  ORF Transcript_19993/g.46722 Transcript_19993/m.46722 type:complete len:359 (+) Transcript_19993:253-1329(+)